MTKDHIKARSRGGSDALKNMQTMCHRCNELKGNGQSKLKRLREIQDGVRTLYMVMRHDRLVSDTFASTYKGLEEITAQEIMSFYGWERKEFSVRVSIRLGTIEVHLTDGRGPLKYNIKTVRRI